MINIYIYIYLLKYTIFLNKKTHKHESVCGLVIVLNKMMCKNFRNKCAHACTHSYMDMGESL